MDSETRTNLCQSNVTCWEGRPKRATKRTRTYWEEFVQEDTWYQKELVRDIPDEEMEAACFDEEWGADAGEEGDEGEEGEAGPDDEEEDPEFLLTEEIEDDESSDSDEGSGTDSEGESGEASSDAGSDGLASGAEPDFSPRSPNYSPEPYHFARAFADSPCHYVPAGSPDASALKAHRGARPCFVPAAPTSSPREVYTPTLCRTPTKED